MSKDSKPRDRWSQVFTAATDRRGFCLGCGYYLAVHDTHRPDCTVAWPKNGLTTAQWHAAYLQRIAEASTSSTRIEDW